MRNRLLYSCVEECGLILAVSMALEGSRTQIMYSREKKFPGVANGWRCIESFGSGSTLTVSATFADKKPLIISVCHPPCCVFVINQIPTSLLPFNKSTTSRKENRSLSKYITHVIFESDVPGIPMATSYVYRRWLDSSGWLWGAWRLFSNTDWWRAGLQMNGFIPGWSPSNHQLITWGELPLWNPQPSTEKQTCLTTGYCYVMLWL